MTSYFYNYDISSSILTLGISGLMVTYHPVQSISGWTLNTLTTSDYLYYQDLSVSGLTTLSISSNIYDYFNNFYVNLTKVTLSNSFYTPFSFLDVSGYSDPTTIAISTINYLPYTLTNEGLIDQIARNLALSISGKVKYESVDQYNNKNFLTNIRLNGYGVYLHSFNADYNHGMVYYSRIDGPKIFGWGGASFGVQNAAGNFITPAYYYEIMAYTGSNVYLHRNTTISGLLNVGRISLNGIDLNTTLNNLSSGSGVDQYSRFYSLSISASVFSNYMTQGSQINGLINNSGVDQYGRDSIRTLSGIVNNYYYNTGSQINVINGQINGLINGSIDQYGRDSIKTLSGIVNNYYYFNGNQINNLTTYNTNQDGTIAYNALKLFGLSGIVYGNYLRDGNSINSLTTYNTNQDGTIAYNATKLFGLSGIVYGNYMNQGNQISLINNKLTPITYTGGAITYLTLTASYLSLLTETAFGADVYLDTYKFYLKSTLTNDYITYGTGRDGPDIVGNSGGRLMTGGNEIIGWNSGSVILSRPIQSTTTFPTASTGGNAGLEIFWNSPNGGGGYTEFLNYGQGGPGGFTFYVGNSTTIPYRIMTLHSGGLSLNSGNMSLENHELRLYASNDPNHFLSYSSVPNGPRLAGWSGGQLGTTNGGWSEVIGWSTTGVYLNRTTTITGDLRATGRTYIGTSDPGGGGGDNAYLEYGAISGEQTVVRLTVQNDADDNINLNPTGGVGINTDTPAYKLDVQGTGRFTSDLHSEQDLYVTRFKYDGCNVYGNDGTTTYTPTHSTVILTGSGTQKFGLPSLSAYGTNVTMTIDFICVNATITFSMQTVGGVVYIPENSYTKTSSLSFGALKRLRVTGWYDPSISYTIWAKVFYLT